MKHKMIGCSEECLRLACCDFCMYVHHEFFFDKDGDIVRGGPVGCGLHDDERHQDIAESCGHCPDFHCFRADEDNMVVKEVDDDEMDKVASDDLPKEDEFDYNKALTWFFGNFFYEGNSDIPGAIVSALDKQIPHLPYHRWQDGSNELACTRCHGNVSKENGKYCSHCGQMIDWEE